MVTLLAALAAIQGSIPLDSIVPANSKPTLVASGFSFLEGPVWTSGRLLFSDIKGDATFELRSATPVPVIKPSFGAIGSAVDPENRLISCSQQNRSVVRHEASGSTTALAEKFGGKPLNGPDDVVIRSDGTIYFTDPGLGLEPQKRPQKVNGVYQITKDRKVELVIRDLAAPNGIAFSPDEGRLYVNDTIRRQIWVYDVDPKGGLSNGKLFAFLTGEMPGLPNGLKVDSRGDVYCTGPGGIQIFSPDAKYIGLIYMREVVNNFCFGDTDGKTLYITTPHSLYKLRLKVAGAKRPTARGR